MSQRQWIGVAISLALLFALSATAFFLPMPALIQDLQQAIQDSGPLGPLVFAFFLLISVVIPPLPTRPLVFSAGVLFDPWWGLLLSLAALTAGAAVNFALARSFGKHWLKNKPDFKDYLKQIELLGAWQAIVLLRLFAGFTFDWFSYLAGLLRVRFRVFILATVAGTTPRLAADVYAGNFLIDQPWLTFGIGATVTIISLSLLARHSRLQPLMRSWRRR